MQSKLKLERNKFNDLFLIIELSENQQKKIQSFFCWCIINNTLMMTKTHKINKQLELYFLFGRVHEMLIRSINR